MIRSILAALAFIAALLLNATLAYAECPIDIAFIEIHAAGDSFIMGDGTWGPNTALRFSYNFAISRSPLTNGQFMDFITEGGYSERSSWTLNGWKWKGKIGQPDTWTDRNLKGPDQPVVGVSWYEAVAYCNWLSAKEGLSPAYDSSGRVDQAGTGYRLPTEAEWEYTAAKGAPGLAERIFPWGDTWDAGKVVCGVAPSRAAKTSVMGSRSPQGDTPQGIPDMSGNVWQWCSDNSQPDAAIRRSAGSDRFFFNDDSPYASMVLRGGSWRNDFQAAYRASYRGYTTYPGNRYDVVGFRIVRRYGSDGSW